MSERIIASGSDFMCFLRGGSVGSYTYKPIAGQTNCTLTREANYRETNAKNLNGYKDYHLGLKGWSATVDMDIPAYSDVNANEVSFEDLEVMQDAGTKSTWVFCWVTDVDLTATVPTPDTTKPMYTGVALVNLPLNAPSGENATTSIALQGCRKLEPVYPT